jgi:flagellar hook protein FlgE
LELNVSGLADGGPYDFGTVAQDTDTSIIGKVYDQGGNAQTYTIAAWDPTAADAGTLTFGDLVLTVDPTALSATGEFLNKKIGSVASGSSTPVSLGYLSLAKFANVDGLSQDGNGYLIQSANSGNPVIVKAGTKGTGTLKSSSLEMSNVDLSKEFTEMITAQRGFQANSRIVTVSDTILEELINLKR